MELFDYTTGESVEAFCADRVVAAPRNDQVLFGYKAHGIYAWVDDVTVVMDAPVELLDRLVEIAEVPHLDSFAKGASTSHNIHVVC